MVDTPQSPAPTPPPAPESPEQDQAALEQARAALGQVKAGPGAQPSALPDRQAGISRQSPAAQATTQPEPTARPQTSLASDVPRLASGSWKFYAAIAGGLVVAGLLVYFLIFFPAALTITATPEGAVITVGDRTATTTLSVRRWPGQAPLTITATGHVTYQETVSLDAGQNQTITIALRPLATPLLLTSQHVQFPVLDEERSSLLYLDPAAKTAYRLGITNPETPTTNAITPPSLDAITDFIWSPNRQLAFLKQACPESCRGGSVTKLYDFKRYDLVNQTITDWPNGVGSVDWRPDGEKVAYYFEPGTGERSLIRATKDNSEVERLYIFADSAVINPTLTWSPDAKLIAIRSNSLFLFDVFAKTLTEVPKTAGVTDVRWLPTSTGLIARAGDGTLRRVGVDATTVELGRSGQLEAIVPLTDGTTFIQANAEANGTVTLERISLAAGTTTPYVADGLTGLVPINLILSADESTLYFTSAGRPYALALDDGTYSDR